MFIFAINFNSMDINRKKVLLISQDSLLSDDQGVTDFHVRQAVLDRIVKLKFSSVAIIFRDTENHAKVKTVEYFVFAYCKVAVSTHVRGDGLLEEIMGTLPHGMRKPEVFVSVGEKIDGVDFLRLEDFL